MAVTVGGTSITFNDGTTQTTAAGGAPTTAQVLSATAGATAGAVGTYAFLLVSNAASFSVSAGSTYAGSSLRFASNNANTVFGQTFSGTPAGTWRCMGFATKTSSGCSDLYSQATVWLRIS